MRDSKSVMGVGAVVVVAVLGLGFGAWDRIRDAFGGQGADVVVSEAVSEAAGADTPALSDTPDASANPTAVPAETAKPAEMAGQTEAAPTDDTPQAEADLQAEAAPQAEAVSETEMADQKQAAALAALMPRFDTMRIGADGALTVAGRSAPNAVVDILVAGKSVAKAVADGRGNFAALVDVPVTTDPRDVALSAVGADGLVAQSDQSLIIAPRSAEEVAASEVVMVPVEVPLDGTPTPEAMADAVTEAVNQANNAEKSAEKSLAQDGAAAPALLLADADGVRVVSAAPVSGLVIDTISYGAEDQVLLAGRGGADGLVLRAYLNDALAGEMPLTGSDWQLALTGVAAGSYNLRVDALDAQGKVVSRAETPFVRETAEVLAQARAATAAETVPETSVGTDAAAPRPADASAARLSVITVQPGNTLWGIASGAYGDGVLYVRLFDANRGQIRNPDLIYPGQVFTIPQ